MKVLFVDESGTHSLDHPDARYPVFVLCGALMEADYHREVLRHQVAALKVDHLGSPDPILRWQHIKRASDGFEALADWTKKRAFLADLRELFLAGDFKLIACSIDHERFCAQYVNPVDPYFYSLEILVERLVMDLATGHSAMIVVESREGADRELFNAWEKIRSYGTDYSMGAEIRAKIDRLIVRSKARNDPGLQIADLAANPIGRHLLGMPLPEGHYLPFEVVASKLRTVNGRWEGCGLKVIP